MPQKVLTAERESLRASGIGPATLRLVSQKRPRASKAKDNLAQKSSRKHPREDIELAAPNGMRPCGRKTTLIQYILSFLGNTAYNSGTMVPKVKYESHSVRYSSRYLQGSPERVRLVHLVPAQAFQSRA
ncbi:unnamed protein product [Prunus armeniaca]|uniref:Uncharacterized protein n=1 Tax=Prunus armeniaca TaxID=36596 RepID=A0A6J5TIG0_PRUAR|nr:unnamed protein product [Prunus armeniaca]CAB4280611.1 unnamed protein product [Prunus armeniaca]CAB4289972.1 unnamed protein product [Prunus armeniaca]CAB4293888.1 unnamed protein product [Prunus armeniaca]CAB4311015.1 unnamed protein product [Prunus armeniaca]